MATESVSGTRTTGVSVSRPNTNGSAQNATAASGPEPRRARASSSQSSQRQVINIDGKSFDRYAPRGTYLNILV
ncbi:hypothetical protein [Telmatospirillum sp.]|uniref:hypothetical protein n=1 Tax=Telmatospirillum sp. TaxID=2079197 RepID=UPI00284CA1F6|nr:hypothetical protein [Telmatospirillum sp.]MDR3440040.1 hypothetical protein [Telmatospirillum sp.]